LEKRDEVLKKNKEKVDCDCGLKISKNCMSRHRGSKVHKIYLKQKNETKAKIDFSPSLSMENHQNQV
jgi:hypothetical protein